MSSYDEALKLIQDGGFPPDTSKSNGVYLNINELVRLSNETRIEVSKLAFYFQGLKT